MALGIEMAADNVKRMGMCGYRFFNAQCDGLNCCLCGNYVSPDEAIETASMLYSLLMYDGPGAETVSEIWRRLRDQENRGRYQYGRSQNYRYPAEPEPG